MEAFDIINKILEISKKGEEYHEEFKKLKTTTKSLEFCMKSAGDSYFFSFSISIFTKQIDKTSPR